MLKLVEGTFEYYVVIHVAKKDPSPNPPDVCISPCAYLRKEATINIVYLDNLQERRIFIVKHFIIST
jgi:hypothetical protein